MIHGKDMDILERDKVMVNFRKGLTKVLIATNVLARGIDVPQVSLVINYDVPVDGHGNPDPPTYLHRIGRSARWGRPGLAFSFVHDDKSRGVLKAIEAYFAPREIKLFRVDDIPNIEQMLREFEN